MPTIKKTIKKPVKKPVKKPIKPSSAPTGLRKSKKIEVKEKIKEDKTKYFQANGSRKTSTARVRLFTRADGGIIVNKKPFDVYFPEIALQKTIMSPLEKLNCETKFSISILVNGGGLTGQAEACRHGISRALILLNPYFRKRLKKAGFLTRDPRMRERKKFGLKRARRAPQWSKR